LASTKPHWKEIALHLMNVLKEYPASKAFWYTEKRDKKEYSQKKTYPINMTKIRRKLDHDVELLRNEHDISLEEDKEEMGEKYESMADFLQDLLTVFRNCEIFVESTKKKYKYSQACQAFVMHLLEKEGIFDDVVGKDDNPDVEESSDGEDEEDQNEDEKDSNEQSESEDEDEEEGEDESQE
jgi:hypothetical protein